MTTLNFELAVQLAVATLHQARALNLKPMAAAVLDSAGHPLAVLRDEQASFLRPQIATGKARGCLGLGFGGRELARRAQTMPAFFDAINSLTGGEVIPVAERRSSARCRRSPAGRHRRQWRYLGQR